MKQILLNREDFKKQVFTRDKHKCVVCGAPAIDAHHIIDRSLFVDGGYYLDNGVSLCSVHHYEAEVTLISTEELRKMAGIKNVIYPTNLTLTEFVKDYDKWGNPILKDGTRLNGYLFNKENVQKVIKPMLHVFQKPYESIVDKYPRTYHFPFSPGTTSDDRIAKNYQILYNKPCIGTEKMDGENTKFSQYGLFARSTAEPTRNPWAQWMKPKWASIKNDLKDFNLEILGENMYGEHSIIYSGLKEHFYVFGIKNVKHNMFLSWEEVKYWAELFDFETAPVLFEYGENKPDDIESQINYHMNKPSLLSNNSIFHTPKEGVVVRLQSEFPADMFYNSVYKYVRKGHVQTDEHWTKTWRRSYLESELLNFDEDKLKEIYEKHINQNLITL